jgi:hypothetical protein
MTQQKTHYRKAFNSPYLSSADIVGPTVLTIKNVVLTGDQTKKTKDQFNTAYFVEQFLRDGERLKPMILNAINSKTLYNLTGSHYLEDWINTPVTIYVDENVRWGRDTVEGLRISPVPPVTKKPTLTRDDPKWDRAVESYKKTGSLDTVLKSMNISKADQDFITKKTDDSHD